MRDLNELVTVPFWNLIFLGLVIGLIYGLGGYLAGLEDGKRKIIKIWNDLENKK